MKEKLKYLYVVAAGALWGMTGIFLKPILNAGFSQAQVITVRSFFSVTVLATVMLIKDKGLFKIKLRDIWCFIGTGIVSFLFFSVSYFYSITYNGVGVAAILLYTSPIFVMLMSLVLFKEKVNGKKIAAIILTICGCVLVSGLAGGENIGLLGFALGICSGIGYALYSIFSRYALQKNYNSMTITFYTFLFCGLGSLTFSSIWEAGPLFSGNSVLLLAGLSIVCSLLPYLCFTKGLQHTDNTKASVIVAVEPVVASVVGVVLYDEQITVTKLLGICLILSAIVICSKD